MIQENLLGETLFGIIRRRRSIRRYQARPVPPDVLARLLEAAIWAPSAHNRQPWRMVVLQSAESRERLARVMGARLRADLRADGVPEAIIEQDVARSYRRITDAATAILLCLTMADMDTYADDRRRFAEHHMAVQSVALAGQNLLLMASASGLGACWMCAPLFCPDAVRDVLELDADWEPQALITLGYPAGPLMEKREKTREPVETRVVWR